MDDAFRGGKDHLADLKAVLAASAARFPAVPVVVVGHSNGSMSATYLAAGAPDQLKSVILVAARLVPTRSAGDGLSKFE